MDKIVGIFLAIVPILLMIGLIPVIQNDFLLTGAYVLIILASLALWRAEHDVTAYVAGFLLMLVAETIFVSTGVETFARNSLFGLMPLWLPFLWGYSFVAIKRIVRVIDAPLVS